MVTQITRKEAFTLHLFMSSLPLLCLSFSIHHTVTIVFDSRCVSTKTSDECVSMAREGYPSLSHMIYPSCPAQLASPDHKQWIQATCLSRLHVLIGLYSLVRSIVVRYQAVS